MKSSDLKSEFLEYIGTNDLLKPHEKTILAVSGGMDSVAMAHLFHKSPFAFALAHCNFQLRGNDADEDENFTKRLADQLGTPFFCQRFNTEEYAEENGLSIQMAAREMRYEWFEHLRLKEGFDKIALAHHLNDQVETILLNLVKGTGISGLRGMPLKRAYIIRPLLFASRNQIKQFIYNNHLKYRIDESNESVKYERNLIRHEVIPVLEKLNPSFINTVSRSVNNVRFAESLFGERLAFYKKRLLDYRKDGIYIPFRRLKSYPFPAHLLFEIIREYGFHWDQANNITNLNDDSSGQEFLSENWRMVKSRNLLVLSPIESKRSSRIAIAKKDQQIELQNGSLIVKFKNFKDDVRFPKNLNVAMLDADKLAFPLVLRPWKKGDYLYPLGMKKASGKVGKKKLSDLFTDLKLSKQEKENAWILQSGEKIAWVAGIRIDDRFKITSSTKRIAVFELERDNY